LENNPLILTYDQLKGVNKALNIIQQGRMKTHKDKDAVRQLVSILYTYRNTTQEPFENEQNTMPEMQENDTN